MIAAPVPAAPHFGPAVTVARSSAPDSDGPGLAIDASGHTLIAWRGPRGQIMVRRGTGRVTKLSPSWSSDTATALAPDGTAAVMWNHDPPGPGQWLEAAVARPGHGFGRIQRIAKVPGLASPVAVLAAGGRLVAVWWALRQVRYAIATGARFGPAHSVARTGEDGSVDAAADAAGDVVVTWDTPIEDTNPQAAAAVLPAGASRFGPPQTVSAGTLQEAPGSLASGMRLFSGPGGMALGYGVERITPWRLQVAPLAGARFAAPATAGTVQPNNGTRTFSGPFVALPAQGGAVAAWTVGRYENPESDTLAENRALVAQQQPDGTFGAPVSLGAASAVGVAATTADVVVAWTSGHRLRYAFRPFTAPRTLTSRAAGDFALAAAGDHVLVGWLSGNRVLVAQSTSVEP